MAFNCYLAIGRYGYFLKSFYDAFPAERIKLLFFDDLVRDPVAVLQDLFGFLGVAPLGDSLPLEQKNRGGIIRNPLMRAVWTRTALLRAGLRRHLPSPIRDSVGKLFLSNMQRPSLDPELRGVLREYFKDDLHHLETLSGRNLDLWRGRAEQPGGQPTK